MPKHITSPEVYLLVVTIIIMGCSCTVKNQRENILVTQDALLPPETFIAKAPVITVLDTCAKPRVVIIPTKKGNYSLRKSIDGPQMIRSAPPDKKMADFFAAMTHYNMEQGLALTSVYKCYEDRKGTLWFATMGGGVSRYDGKSFTNYSAAHGLGHNGVYSIFEDSKNNLWFATMGGGASCYDGRSFINYTTAHGLGSNVVYEILEDKRGNIWFGTAGGVTRCDPLKKHFANFTTANGLQSNFIMSILEESSGDLWLGTAYGLSKLAYDDALKPGNQLIFTRFNGLRDNVIYQMLEDKHHKIWVGTYDGLYSFNPHEILTGKDEPVFERHSTEQGLRSNIVMDVCEDRDGNIWLGTFGGGISRFDGQSFVNFSKEQGLSDNNAHSVIADKNGNIWVGTTGGGVSRLDRKGKCINTYTSDQGLVNYHVQSIIRDKKDNLWFGTEGGLSRLDKDEKYFLNYNTAQGMVDYSIYALLEDQEGNIWFTTEGDGVSRLDTGLRSITTFTTKQGLVNNDVLSLTQTRNGDIWFATLEGVSKYNGVSFTSYTTAQGLLQGEMFAILEDKKGNIWFCTNNGLASFDGKSFTHYSTGQGLSNKVVRCILEDKNGNLWIGTQGGVNRFDGSSFTRYTTEDGLPDDMIIALVMDNNGFLWMGTNKGFAVLKGFNDGKTPKAEASRPPGTMPSNNLSNDELKRSAKVPVFEIFNLNTGYQVKDIYSSNAMCVTNNNIIWSGTGDKLVRFDYSAVEKNPGQPHLFIRSIKINNEKVCWNNLKHDGQIQSGNSMAENVSEEVTLFGRVLGEAQRDSLAKKFAGIQFDSISRFYTIPQNPVLPYRYNNLAFDFAAIEPARPGLVNYQYKLEGYDDDWSPVSNKTDASFGNINEGDYTFKLKAQSPDGVWSAPLEYRFTVLPPWFRTWWAYGLYAIIFIAILGRFIKWRLRVLRKEKDRLAEKLEMQNAVMNERSRISRELHDEVGATLSGISMYSHLTKGQIKMGNIPEVEKSLNIMQQSAGEMVNKLNDIVWLVNPEHDSLQQLVQRLEEYATDMAVIKNMQVNVKLPGTLIENEMPVESRRNIYLFCKEAINNAVKYSEGTLLELTVKDSNGMLEFIVNDNGKGFDPPTVRRGNGLENMQKRADEIGAKLTLESEKGKGSYISLQVKII